MGPLVRCGQKKSPMSLAWGDGALNAFCPGRSCLALLDLKCFRICNGYNLVPNAGTIILKFAEEVNRFK